MREAGSVSPHISPHLEAKRVPCGPASTREGTCSCCVSLCAAALSTAHRHRRHMRCSGGPAPSSRPKPLALPYPKVPEPCGTHARCCALQLARRGVAWGWPGREHGSDAARGLCSGGGCRGAGSGGGNRALEASQLQPVLAAGRRRLRRRRLALGRAVQRRAGACGVGELRGQRRVGNASGRGAVRGGGTAALHGVEL